METNASSPANEGPEILDANWEIPPFPLATEEFSKELIAANTFGVVAAKTGGFKTLFLCNLAAVALQLGRQVGFVALDMKYERIFPRIWATTSDVPAAMIKDGFTSLQPTPTQQDHLAKAWPMVRSITPVDSTVDATTPDRLTAIVSGVVAKGCNVVLVDGLDALCGGDDTKTALLETALGELSRLVNQNGIALWATSQCRRGTESREILLGEDVAFNIEKIQRSSIVVTLGHRVPSFMVTAVIAKDRERSEQSRQLHRLVLTPSLRLVELETRNGLDITGLASPAKPAFLFLGPALDLPAGSQDGHSASDEDARSADHRLPSKPYHGTDGFVPIGRRLFSTAMFTNRDLQYVFWVLDLYEMAQFERAQIYAPATQIPVQLERGQVLTSVRILQKRWDCASDHPVRTFLHRAADQGIIRVQFVDANGKAMADASKDAPSAAGGRSIGTIITLLDYWGSVDSNGAHSSRNDASSDASNDASRTQP